MTRPVSLVQYWGGCPDTANSKWLRFVRTIRRCAEEGWRTHLVLSRMPEDPALSRAFLDCGCKIIVDPSTRLNLDMLCIRHTTRILREARADILHCHNVHTSPLIAARIAGVPVRIWSKLAMSPYYERGIRPKGHHRLMPTVRLSCSLAQLVLALSNAIREELLGYGVAASRVKVLPAPVELDPSRDDTRVDLRRRLGVSPTDVLVTAVGHAVPVKGWDVLIRAFQIVSEAQASARLLLVGSLDSPEERPFAEKLLAMVRASGLDRRAIFAGHRKDVAQVLKASDLFAFPSRSDGQGLALTEAMAAGLPCVAAEVGGIPDLITHGKNGLLFPRENHRVLAGYLSNLVSKPDLRRSLASAARADGARYSMDSYVNSLLDYYRSLLPAPFS